MTKESIVMQRQSQAQAQAQGTPSPADDRRNFRGRGSALSSPLISLAVFAVLVALPFVASVQTLTLANRILAMGLMAASLSLLVGTAGLPSLAHATFSGVGGYAAALVAIHWTSSALLQLAAALGAAVVCSMIIGMIVVRATGVYFLLLTLIVGQLVYYLAESLTSITGGANGLSGVPVATLPVRAELGGVAYVYWYVLAATVLGYFALRTIVGSAFGLTLKGIRDNEKRMISLGVRTRLYKYTAFCLAGGVAGYAGALNTVQQRFVSPYDIGYSLSAMLLLAVIIGGRSSLGGAFAGATVIVLVQNELSAHITGHGELLLGVVFVVIILFMPEGLQGLQSSLNRIRRSTKNNEKGQAA